MKRLTILLTGLVALLLLTAAPACASTAAQVTLTTAQIILEPYSFFVTGDVEGLTAVNSRFLAREGRVNIVAEYRGPDPENPGQTKVLWRKEIQADAGRRVYKAVFGGDGRFLTIVPATWEEARASMPYLPS